jgi:hypothetical protein
VLLGLLISFGLTLPYVFDRNLTTTVKESGIPTGPAECSKGFSYTPKVGSHAAQCTGKVNYPDSHWLLLMVLLLVFTIAIFVTVRIGRRVPMGFAILVAGIAYESTVGLLGLIFIVPGAWLLFKAWRVRRDLANGELPQSGGPKGRSAPSRPAPPGGSGPNKRYTPKAAPAKGAQSKSAPAKRPQSKAASPKGAAAKTPKKRPTPPTS